ncbi:replication initiator [Promicromonospora sp. NPDC052451]|uniref:replication initiator n=1 Tax=Promicromonospora sp. NPDC052451 TaxID=3364407 RepID=UPI0037C6626A
MVSFRTTLDTHAVGLDVEDAARQARDLARAGAEANGVCTSPVVRSVFDRETGVTHLVPIPCGSTRESKCKACAEKARRLRMHQCREGWHRDDEPDLPPAPTAAPDEDEDDDEKEDEPAPERVTRSTRRRPDVPDLPTQKMSSGTLGRTFTDPRTGQTFRPSMFLTLTLGSYGDIGRRRRADGTWESTGVPANPRTYDYRKAALDALMFSRVVDRFMQNLRRCAGYTVQYFAAVEPQKRLAPHLHAAIRGTIPRAIVKQVAAATYFAAWWPPCTDADVVYGEHTEPPVWHEESANYLDPHTGEVLPTWKEATAQLQDPAHVVRLGKQVDIKGLLGGTPDSDHAVRYLCKYLTKSISGTYAAGDDDADTAARVAYDKHVDRLHAHVRVLPCGPDCANWLRYGVQPKNPTPGMKPGGCLSPAHDRENLGLGGRRVLVSRGWSGKTLTQHRADRAAVVRQALEAAGIEHDDADRLSTTQETSDGHARYVWREPEAGSYTYAAVITASLQEHLRRRGQYDAAKQALGLAPPGSTGPVDNRSATAATPAAHAA